MRWIHRRRRDRQQAEPAAQCAQCGGELYEGCPYWRLGGRVLCEECLMPWLLAELAPFRREWGEVER